MQANNNEGAGAEVLWQSLQTYLGQNSSKFHILAKFFFHMFSQSILEKIGTSWYPISLPSKHRERFLIKAINEGKPCGFVRYELMNSICFSSWRKCFYAQVFWGVGSVGDHNEHPDHSFRCTV